MWLDNEAVTKKVIS